ncbi:MAG: hypothetical protein J5821_00160 [Alphaproteobacteria bacterium]|nr:hypothetical protein [Alphaproteobacteria bacterium]
MGFKQRKIIGHRKQLEIIAKSINSGKVFPVWIFSGADGIGKTSVAYKFAKCLLADLDSVNENLDIPDDSKIHNWVDNRTHPDFFVMDGASSSIDEARILMGKVCKAPSLSKRRVVIIENADRLNKNICNSLLKILEEPPRDTVFILVCANVGGMPITLLSRAIKLKFSPLSQAEVELALSLFDVGNASVLASIADGSVGDALYLHENNGVDLFQNFLNAFSSDYETSNKVVKHIISNKLCDNFSLIKQLIIRVLKIYTDTITEIKVDDHFSEFIGRVSIDREMKKVLQVISNLNRGEALMLDKNGLVAEAFEIFFERYEI